MHMPRRTKMQSRTDVGAKRQTAMLRGVSLDMQSVQTARQGGSQADNVTHRPGRLETQSIRSRVRCHAPGGVPVVRWNIRAKAATL